MKRALLKDTLKQILKTYKRFLSILIMALLGVGFFAGIRATSPDMKKTADKFFDECNFYDIEVVSTLGLTEDDVKALEKIDGVERVYPTFSCDAILSIDKVETVVKVHEIEDVNKIELIDGYMPETNTECVVEENLIKNTNLKIGDYIELKDDDENLVNNRCKITGTVKSPLYISRERGTSSLGSGKVSYYIYIPKKNVDSDIYTSIYISVKDTKDMLAISDEYKEKVNAVQDNIEKIKKDREDERYNNLIDDANEELDDATKKLEKEKKDAQEKIKDAEKEIKDGEKELKEGREEFNKEKEDASKKIQDAEAEIKKGYDELNSGETKLNEQKAIAEEQFKEAENKKAELELNLEQIIQGLEEIDNNIKNIEFTIKNYGNSLSQAELAKLKQTKILLESKKTELEENQQMVLQGIKMIELQTSNGREELRQAEEQIKLGYEKLNEATVEINKNKEKANSEFAKAEKEILDGEKELKEGKAELEKNKKEFEEKIADAEKKLFDAREELNDVKEAKWYIFDRDNNTGYNSYSQDTENVAKIGNVFPVVFFVIATLISLTTMTRMIEENRTQIGTFKALGYTNKQIALKYVIYALLASVIGGIIGMLIGFNTLPVIIITMYQMMYISMNLIIEFNVEYAVMGLGIMTLCIVGATISTIKKEVKFTPAELMRPKAPKAGKRILLEHIPFLWKRLSFSKKVTLRNMFRYKKRFLMTVIGIAGCTALIVAGFGMKDSISGIMEIQYNGVYNFDMMINLKDTLTVDEITELEKELNDRKEIERTTGVYAEAANVINGKNRKEAQVIVEKEKGSLDGIINLTDRKTKEIITLDDETVVITDKLAILLNVDVGDEIILEDTEKEEYHVKVGAIVENYIMHYVYMSENVYEKVYGKSQNVNILYTKYSQEYDVEKEEELSKEILENPKTSIVILTSELRKTMDETINSMNFVIYVLILSAGILAFVVLYNLSNINISERIRELATIKVLGFYDKEVYDYVTREIVLLTIIGIIVGLIFGYILTSFILGTCELDSLRFKKIVMPISYVYGVLITGAFNFIVNIATYFSLKKIDMIESLKSVE